MSFLDMFRTTVRLDREAYAELLRESQDKRDECKRLQADIDSLRTELREAKKEGAELARQLLTARQPRLITKEDIAKQLHIPVSLVDKIDLGALNRQFPEGH